MCDNGSGYQPRKTSTDVVARPPRNPSGELSRFIKLADLLMDISEIAAVSIGSSPWVPYHQVLIVIKGGVELSSPLMNFEHCQYSHARIQGLLTSSMYRNTTTIHDVTPPDYVPLEIYANA